MTDRVEFDPRRARRYRKRSEILAFRSVDAVTYHKSWGRQDLPPGGWVAVALDADGVPRGEVYGIDEDAFDETYAPSLTGQPHRFMKTATIEAYQVGHDFIVSTILDDKTNPGQKKIEVETSKASATAMLVRNPGGEIYPIELEEFERMYVEVHTPRRARNRDDHLNPALGPKRILSIDGGGVRSVFTLGVLASIERLIRQRHADPSLTLSDYFDLIAGTSTGALVGAGLAAGQTVDELLDWFRPLAPHLFGRQWTAPLLPPKHDPTPIQAALRSLFGDARLDDDRLQTGLLVITRRLDALRERQGVWPLLNSPQDPEWTATEGRAGRSQYLLREVIRASAAAPFPLQPEVIDIFEGTDAMPAERGQFINGGISPHNNPAWQALATAAGSEHGLGWATGTERLFMVSVGAGRSSSRHELRGMSLPPAVQSLHRLLDEGGTLIEEVMRSLSARDEDAVASASVKGLDADLIGEEPLLAYVRYDAHLEPTWLERELGIALSDDAIHEMQPLDARDRAIDDLIDVGRAVGDRRVGEADFPADFDLLDD